MLELIQIRKSFDGTAILDRVDMEVPDGEIVSVLGPSECGKMTLMRIVLGMEKADMGQILFRGRDLTRTPMEERGFQVVFRDCSFFPNMNVYKNIVYGLRNRPGISNREEVEKLIDLLELRKILGNRVGMLTTGQKECTALARILVMKPKVLLLEDPFADLDEEEKDKIIEMLRKIIEKYHITIMMTVRDSDEALKVSDKILILNRGRVAQYGTPQEILFRPETPFIKEFIAASRRGFHQYGAASMAAAAPANPASALAFCQNRTDFPLHQIKGNIIHSAVGNDVCKDPGGFYIEIVHWFHRS